MLDVLVGREVEMFKLVPKVRSRQCIVQETDRKTGGKYPKELTEKYGEGA